MLADHCFCCSFFEEMIETKNTVTGSQKYDQPKINTLNGSQTFNYAISHYSEVV